MKIKRASPELEITMPDHSVETIDIGYKYYQSYQGDGQKSGAYIFRPSSDTPKTFSTIHTVYYFSAHSVACVVFEGNSTLTKVYFPLKEGYFEEKGFEV